MRALIERLRLAARNWLNAKSAAERAYQSEIDEAVRQMRESLRRD